jgi:sulfoxide reductase heme-binding subunit YedZ
VFVAGLAPVAYLAWRAATDGLGANPIEAITLFTGRWTLRFLLVTLAVTPLRRVTGWHEAIRYRRMLGLFTFFYAALHFGTYIVLDQFFAWAFILKDIAKRPYITVGFSAFVLMVPLALTSTKGWIRRLGRRWQVLHRLVYVSAVFGVVHFFWKVKADTRDPFIYAAILAGLLAVRLWFWFRARTR